jgi:hypothetical protein
VVLAWDGLHHILLLERLLEQVRTALTPDGLFIFSDNIGLHPRSRILGGVLYLLLPTYLSYWVKCKYALGGESRIKQDMVHRSPFEEISSDTLIRSAERFFHFLSLIPHTGIGYRAAIAGDLRCPGFIRYPFLRALKRFDDWAVRTGLLKGDHVLVVAKPG